MRIKSPKRFDIMELVNLFHKESVVIRFTSPRVPMQVTSRYQSNLFGGAGGSESSEEEVGLVIVGLSWDAM